MAASPSTLITVTPTGAESSRADVPALPPTLDELVATAKACEQAGAAVIHVHIRDDRHEPTLDLGRLRDTVAALREQTDLVVQLSTGGSAHDRLEDQLRVLEAEPDMRSPMMGTPNFGDDVFMNPWPFVVELYEQTIEREVVPQLELFDRGHFAAAPAAGPVRHPCGNKMQGPARALRVSGRCDGTAAESNRPRGDAGKRALATI